jgi:hypothetical protein
LNRCFVADSAKLMGFILPARAREAPSVNAETRHLVVQGSSRDVEPSHRGANAPARVNQTTFNHPPLERIYLLSKRKWLVAACFGLNLFSQNEVRSEGQSFQHDVKTSLVRVRNGDTNFEPLVVLTLAGRDGIDTASVQVRFTH